MTTKKIKDKLGSTKEIMVRRLRILQRLTYDETRWRPPMDVGGTDSSHHSKDLARMVKLGIVDRKRFYKGCSGGHWEYRINGAGLLVLRAHK